MNLQKIWWLCRKSFESGKNLLNLRISANNFQHVHKVELVGLRLQPDYIIIDNSCAVPVLMLVGTYGPKIGGLVGIDSPSSILWICTFFCFINLLLAIYLHKIAQVRRKSRKISEKGDRWYVSKPFLKLKKWWKNSTKQVVTKIRINKKAKKLDILQSKNLKIYKCKEQRLMHIIKMLASHKVYLVVSYFGCSEKIRRAISYPGL